MTSFIPAHTEFATTHTAVRLIPIPRNDLLEYCFNRPLPKTNKENLQMRKGSTAALSVLCAMTLTGGLLAQARTEIEVTRADIQTDRKAIVAANLPLSEAQASAFWPVYREYRGEMDVVGDRTVKLLTDYAASYETLTDDKASALVTEHLNIQKELLKIKSKYAPRFDKVLPPKS